LPLGNSITQTNSEHYSYCYNLWKKLIDCGYHFDFVGSLNSNFGGNPSWPKYQDMDFDPNHEEHWAWRADKILQDLPDWLNGYTADIALVHLRTNDVAQYKSNVSTVSEIKKIIDTPRNDNSNIDIMLAKLIPFDYPTVNDSIDDLNSRMDQIAAKESTTDSLVIIVDQNIGFDVGSDTFDGFHPNASGEEKMAMKWYTAIDSIFGSTTDGDYSSIGTDKYRLDNNYPNQFNPATKIEFHIPKPTIVKIEIFNALGQKIMTLLDELMPLGSH
jgi:lysophospholipase L1-like esterase